MKTKNIILGIVSLLLSVGSVFASLSTIAPDSIHVKYQGDTNFTCTNIPPYFCRGGAVICQVSVLANGVVQSTPVYETKISVTTCILRITDSQSSLGAIAKARTIIAADPL